MVSQKYYFVTYKIIALKGQYSTINLIIRYLTTSEVYFPTTLFGKQIWWSSQFNISEKTTYID